MKKVLNYKVVLGCFIIVSVFSSISLVDALEPLVLYDDFNSMFIDAEKWKGIDNNTQEVFRYIRGRRLNIYQSYSDSNLIGFNALQFRNPGAVTAMKTTIKVNHIYAGSCQSSGDTGWTAALAQVAGSFFNSLHPPNPSDQTGDVRPQCQVQRLSNSPDPINTLRVLCSVTQCQNASCSLNVPITNIILMGNVNLGKSVTLYIQWDKDIKRFIFQRDNEPPVDLYYDFDDAFPPSNSFKQLCVVGVPLCHNTPPQFMTSVEASFDNVYVNQSAAP